MVRKDGAEEAPLWVSTEWDCWAVGKCAAPFPFFDGESVEMDGSRFECGGGAVMSMRIEEPNGNSCY